MIMIIIIIIATDISKKKKVRYRTNHCSSCQYVIFSIIKNWTIIKAITYTAYSLYIFCVWTSPQTRITFFRVTRTRLLAFGGVILIARVPTTYLPARYRRSFIAGHWRPVVMQNRDRQRESFAIIDNNGRVDSDDNGQKKKTTKKIAFQPR